MTRARHGLGWLPDLPDFRDYRLGSPEIARAVPSFGATKKASDLRPYFSPVEDQGALGSCTAQAAVGLLEYLERRVAGRHVEASRRFLYLATRRMAGFTGDSGAYLRGTMGALAVHGAPPERWWPYDVARFDEEPPARIWSAAQRFRAVRYFRLDGATPQETLANVRRSLSAGWPVMFGFTVYSSIWGAEQTGDIPYPAPAESVEGGHALVACGHDDERQVLLVRNSWGDAWGLDGYGSLPYRYVLDGLAGDFWSLTRAEWVDVQPFQE